MYPLPLRITGLVVVAILCLVVGYGVYIAFRKGKPVAPRADPPRNWTPDLTAYINLIKFALIQPDPCCLPIDPAFLASIEAWYEEEREDITMYLKVLHRGGKDKMARLYVSSQESPTGKHKAIR